MRQIAEFELIDHGIEHSQYFQGCGVAFTRFTNVVTGIGNNPADAIDDCLEQIAQMGFDTEGMEECILTREGWKSLPVKPNVFLECAHFADFNYYVSIRWNRV